MPAARPVPQPPATPYVLFAGRFVAKKGIADLLAAMRILATNGTPVGLHLIGDGPEEGAMRAAATGIPGVEFLGWRGNDEVRQRMQHALAVCVPSVTAPDGDSEGLPTVAIEAMAQGTPVIGTNHAGIVEAVRDEQTGLLVPQGDPTALANAIRRLANDPNLRAGLGEAAWREADAHFNAMTQSRQLEEFFLTLRRQNA
jgi:glycosyltransferase involved in cell wall biosynthesis